MTDTTLGKHLLGRIPSTPDSRDYPLALWLKEQPTPLEDALKTLLSSHAARATKTWAQIATPLILGGVPTPIPPSPGPPAPAPSTAVTWDDNEPVLDQGQTGHCVGFGCAQWGNTLPIDDKFDNVDGDDLYYEAKVIDGEPKAEDGSSVRSGVTALKNRGRLATYAFAKNVDEGIAWIQQHGPVIWGTDWTNDMFTPAANGVVVPTGGVAGGHCYAGIGYDPATDLIENLNSWGDGWSLKGRFYIKRSDMAALFASNGECAAAAELPIVSSPSP